MEIFISGNVPSSKNSKEICWGEHMPRPILKNSKTVEKYLKTYEFQWALANNKQAFHKALEGKEKPYKIGFYFVRDSKRKFDLINACQLPCDLMVKWGWIEDDNADEIIPVFQGYEVDKSNAGIRIEVLE